jgi:hypothetical protein
METMETTEQYIERIYALSVSVNGDANMLYGNANFLLASELETSMFQCEMYISKLEDAIKRFREGRPQSFEEKG